MNIKTVENECIKLMRKLLDNLKILNGISNNNTFNEKIYTEKEIEKLYKDVNGYFTNLRNIIPAEEQQDIEKIKIVNYYSNLTNFFIDELPRKHYNELSNYECNILKKITYIRDIIEAEKEVLQEEKDNILLEKIKNNDIADIVKNNTLYTNQIKEEAIKKVQQGNYKRLTFKTQAQDEDFRSKCIWCNLNILTLLINLQSIKYIANYFENKYKIDITYNLPLLNGSPLDEAYKEALEVLKNVIHTVPNFEQHPVYTTINRFFESSQVQPNKDEQDLVKELIESDYKQFAFNSDSYIEELKSKEYIRLVAERGLLYE